MARGPGVSIDRRPGVAKSKFKDYPQYARARRGHIGIQDHGDWAAFRNIQIRELGWTPLFNGKDLTGWKNYGAEKWTVEKPAAVSGSSGRTRKGKRR